MRRILGLALLGVLFQGTPAQAQYYRPGGHEALVRSWYHQFLNREAEPYGMVNWVEHLRLGNAPEQVLAHILASDEYYVKSGYTPAGFVRTLLLDLTGQEPSPRDFHYWVRRASVESRADVAYAMLMRYGWGRPSRPYPDRSPGYGGGRYPYPTYDGGYIRRPSDRRWDD
jgi:hypothetical protein